jgi:outer membrane immunogenic protein
MLASIARCFTPRAMPLTGANRRRASASGVSYPATESVTRVGWTAGGGIEYAFTGNLTAKVEGLYYDLGEDTISAHPVPVPNTFTRGMTFETQGAIARAGINYKFDWGSPVVARY